jgi:hypothetical protein
LNDYILTGPKRFEDDDSDTRADKLELEGKDQTIKQSNDLGDRQQILNYIEEA